MSTTDEPGTAPTGGIVIACGLAGRDPGGDHEAATLMGVAERLARLKGYRWAGAHDPATLRHDGPVYRVPPATVVGVAAAAAMGIRGEDDLFGGVVPFDFVATKSITHPVVSAHARKPPGWTHAVADWLGDAVLSGFTVFGRDDAREAAGRLRALGPVRVKRVLAAGGHGQSVARSAAELEEALAGVDDAELGAVGLVLEQHLESPTTYCVGMVRVADLRISYWGTQRQTPNHRGESVYGGSDLRIVRGGLDALLAQVTDDEVRTAIEAARIYDGAVTRCFPGFFASRRNYDIAFGQDAAGRRRYGVLEQSWRIGGASGAEIAALEAFRDDASLASVSASTVEVFGDPPLLPPGAVVYFSGVDRRVGPMTKYATLAPDGRRPPSTDG